MTNDRDEERKNVGQRCNVSRKNAAHRYDLSPPPPAPLKSHHHSRKFGRASTLPNSLHYTLLHILYKLRNPRINELIQLTARCPAATASMYHLPMMPSPLQWVSWTSLPSSIPAECAECLRADRHYARGGVPMIAPRGPLIYTPASARGV